MYKYLISKDLSRIKSGKSTQGKERTNKLQRLNIESYVVDVVTIVLDLNVFIGARVIVVITKDCHCT